MSAAVGPLVSDPATDGHRSRSRRGFPWRTLLATWAVVSVIMVARFWHAIVNGEYVDADDLMRLLEVRDLMAGQSWFDLTQYRLDPPVGLPMHWSRLVDIPLLLFMAPLKPLIGQKAAEMIAVTAVPLLTLGATMAALLTAIRRTIGTDPLAAILAPFMLVVAPAVLIQIFPTRIDHHGWQICLGTLAFAALLDPRPRRSGLIAGAATAAFLAISLEGLPYAVAEAGALALLWTFGRESSIRVTAFLQMLAGFSIACFVLTAPYLRWTTSACDVVKPAHLIVFTLAAIGMLGVVRLSRGRNWRARLAGLALLGIGCGIVFALLAPNCLGSPFGAMDPLVRHFWYDNVIEGLPIWRQSPLGATTMIAFPIVGLTGAILRLRTITAPERRRRWLLVVLLGCATLVTGALVRRAAGLSNVVAIPGAFVILQYLRVRVEAIDRPLFRIPLAAAMIFAVSPLAPVWAVSLVAPDLDGAKIPIIGNNLCDWRCGMRTIDRLPPATMFTDIDLAPRLIAMTHHKAYAGGYHRLEGPLHRTIKALISSDEVARGIICDPRFDYVLIAPGEGRIYRHAAPDGFMAHLLAGRTPVWLRPLPLPTTDLRLYRIDHGAACRG